MGKDSMNIVTIKAKALLAADRLLTQGYLSSETVSQKDLKEGCTEVIESCFTPDPANESNKDLIEALQALKTLRDTICNSVIPLSGKTRVVSSCIYEAGKILKKYSNLI